MTTSEIMIGLAILLLTLAAWLVSTRRNKEAIDNFDCDGLDQLKICLSDWQLPSAEKKLAKLGWQRIRTERQQKGHVYAWFEQSSDEIAVPIKEVLNKLNRAGYLSVSPMKLNKEDGQRSS